MNAFTRSNKVWNSTQAYGFSLVELMVIVALIGAIYSIITPQYRRARILASATIQANAALSAAMQCRLLALSKIGFQPSPQTGILANCSADGGTVSTVFANGVEGIRCLQSISNDTDITLTITISDQGSMSCTFN